MDSLGSPLDVIQKLFLGHHISIPKSRVLWTAQVSVTETSYCGTQTFHDRNKFLSEKKVNVTKTRVAG